VRYQRLIASICAAAALTGLVACSTVGSKTCSQYASMSMGDRLSAQRDLLREHDLDTSSIGNMTGVSEALDSYCGVSSYGSTASKNLTSQLDQGVNWDSEYW
jgi:hypothetical protein